MLLGNVIKFSVPPPSCISRVAAEVFSVCLYAYVIFLAIQCVLSEGLYGDAEVNKAYSDASGWKTVCVGSSRGVILGQSVSPIYTHWANPPIILQLVYFLSNLFAPNITSSIYGSPFCAESRQPLSIKDLLPIMNIRQHMPFLYGLQSFHSGLYFSAEITPTRKFQIPNFQLSVFQFFLHFLHNQLMTDRYTFTSLFNTWLCQKQSLEKCLQQKQKFICFGISF